MYRDVYVYNGIQTESVHNISSYTEVNIKRTKRFNVPTHNSCTEILWCGTRTTYKNEYFVERFYLRSYGVRRIKLVSYYLVSCSQSINAL